MEEKVDLKSDDMKGAITYNPALDHLQGEILFKEKIEEGKAFFKKYGLPKKVMDKLKSEMIQNNNK